MDRFGRNMDDNIPSCPRRVRRDAVAMVTAVAWLPRIEHLAVMGVWRRGRIIYTINGLNPSRDASC